MSSGQPFPSTRSNGLATGCIGLFLLPFLVTSAGILAVGIMEWRAHAPQAVLLMLMGAVFSALSLTLFFYSVGAQRRAARNATLEAANPGQPWTWRADWRDRRIKERRSPTVGLLWLFALFWNALTIPIGLMLFPSWQQQRNPLFFVILIFAAVGAGLIGTAAFRSLRQHKFGRGVCTIERIPIEPGSTLRGAMELRSGAIAADGYFVSLRCIHRVESGSARSRSVNEIPLWQQDEQVSAAAVIATPSGELRIPFSIAIPAEARSTDTREANDQILWRLEVSAPMTGLDYHASFDLPVFHTMPSPLGGAIASYHVAHPAAAIQRPFRAGSGISATTLADGRTEYRVKSMVTVQGILSFAAFIALWTGAIVLMARSHASLLITGFFTLMGLVLVVAAIDYAFGVSIIRSGPRGLEFQRLILGRGSFTEIDSSRIESVSAVPGGESGRSTGFDVVISTTDLQKRVVARSLANPDDAETLAARLWAEAARNR